MPPKIYVSVLDDEPSVRKDLRLIFSTASDIELISEASNVHQLMLSQNTQSHVLLFGNGRGQYFVNHLFPCKNFILTPA